MPTLIECLTEAGVTNKDLIDLAKKYKGNPAKLNKRLNEVSESAQLRARQAILQKNAQKRVEAILEPFTDPVERAKVTMDLMSMAGIRGHGIVSLESKIDGVLSPVHKELADMMEAYHPKALGFSASKKGQRDMVRAIFGDEILDVDARAYAQSWQKVVKLLKDRYNKAGGGIVELEDWNLPQSHDPLRIGRSNFEEWYGFVKERIKIDRVVPEKSQKTGKVIEAGEREVISRKILESVYKSLKNDGYSKIDTSALSPYVKRKVGNRHQEHRLLHFKDADSWMQYSDKYGGPDYFNSMMGYTEMMAREIGAMETFGPNPDAMVEQLVKSIPGRKGTGVSNTYKEIMGRNYGFNNKLGNVSQMFRNMEVGTKLGFAMIPALSDAFFTALTAAYNGLPVLKTTMKAIINLAPATNKSNRITLNKIGLLGEYAINKARATNRLSEVWGYGKSARFADMTIRASGLNYWTTAVRESFQLEFMSNMAEMSARSWNDIGSRFRGAMQRYGINEMDWGIISRSEKYTKGGSLNFVDASKLPEGLREKVVAMIKEETVFAVPEPTAKVQAMLHQGTARGTAIGEMARTMTQFKAFPVSILASHFHRGLNLKGISRMTYMGSLLAGTTAVGMAVVQAKDMLKGKTPRDLDASLIYDGMLQGGSLGILGDFALNDPDSFGGLAGQIAGPVIGDAAFLHKVMFGSASAVFDSEKKIADKLKSAGVQVTKKWTPGQLWYTKLAMERFMLDSLDKNLNSNWHKRQRKLTKRMKKEKGQEWWWKPGSSVSTAKTPIKF